MSTRTSIFGGVASSGAIVAPGDGDFRTPIFVASPIIDGPIAIDGPGNTVVAPIATPIISGPIDASGPFDGGTGGAVLSGTPVMRAIDSSQSIAGGSTVATVKAHPIASIAVVLAIILLFL